MGSLSTFAVLYLLAALAGVRNIYYWVPSLLDLLIPLAISLTLVLWAISDASRRRRPLPLTARSWMVLSGPLSVSGYLIWTRTWRGAGLVLANFLGMSAVTTLVMHAGGYLLFGREWLAALGGRP